MDTEIIAFYCVCDDLLKAMNHVEDRQCQMSDAEVMTTAILAGRCFGGNIESARAMLQQQGYIPTMLSRSRLNRRLHRVKKYFLTLFETLAEHWKALNSASLYAVDTFPVAACDPYRILRVRLYQGEEYRGYTASKRRYFYGLKIHLLVTAEGQPVEFFLTPGSCADVKMCIRDRCWAGPRPTAGAWPGWCARRWWGPTATWSIWSGCGGAEHRPTWLP